MAIGGRLVDVRKLVVSNELMEGKIPADIQIDQMRDESMGQTVSLDDSLNDAAALEDVIDVEGCLRAWKAGDETQAAHRCKRGYGLLYHGRNSGGVQDEIHTAVARVLDQIHSAFVSAVDHVRRAQLARHLQPFVDDVDREYRRCAANLRGEQGAQSHCPGAVDRKTASRLHVERIHYGASAGLHPA